MTTNETILMTLARAVRSGEDAAIDHAVEAAIEAGEALLDREEPLDPDREPADDYARHAGEDDREAAPCIICGAPTCAGCGACGEEDCPALSGCTCEARAILDAAPLGPYHLRGLDGSTDARCGAESTLGLWTAELLAKPVSVSCPTCRQIAVILAGPDDEEPEA